ncbi:MAG: tetratricopeptide repeat-containing sensor histidine kinase [Bacteroidia bacterium]|jgi:signal transduction histidine kinase
MVTIGSNILGLDRVSFKEKMGQRNAKFYKTISVFILLELIFISPVGLFAQQEQIKRLIQELKLHPTEDTTRVRLLNELSNSYQYMQTDSMLIIGNEAYRIASGIDDKKGQADALKMSAIGEYYGSREREAIRKNHQALHLYTQINNQKGIGDILNNMAIIYHNRGEFDKALSYYQRSLNLRTKIKDYKGIAACYNNIGNVYTNLGNFPESLANLYKGLSVREQIGDSLPIANSFANIAGVYIQLKRTDDAFRFARKAYDYYWRKENKDGLYQTSVIYGDAYRILSDHKLATHYYKAALRLSEEMQNDNAIAVSLTNLGTELEDQNQLKEAEICFKRSLELSKLTDDMEGIVLSNIHLGEIEVINGNFVTGIDRLKEGLSQAQSIHAKYHIHNAALKLSKYYEQRGNYKEALVYQHICSAYKDSLFNDETRAKMQQTEFNYRLDKKQKEIQLLEMQRTIHNESSAQQQLIISGLSVAFILFALFLVYLYRNIRKEKTTNKQIAGQKLEIEQQAFKLEELNTLKDKIFSVMSHDLRSPVASLLNMIDLLDEKEMTQQEFLQFQENIRQQLTSLNLLLDNLLIWSRSQMLGIRPRFIAINVNDKIHKVCEIYLQAADVKHIELTCTIDNDLQVKADPDYLALVLRNVVSNAIKYTSEGGSINISARDLTDGIEICVRDNGIGMNERLVNNLLKNTPMQSAVGTSGEKGAGIGLLLCNEFIQKTGGQLRVESEPGIGSSFYISLPKA